MDTMISAIFKQISKELEEEAQRQEFQPLTPNKTTTV